MPTWNIDQSLAQRFCAECLEAVQDPAAFMHFRQGDAMTAVVENTPPKWAQQVLAHAQKFVSHARFVELCNIVRKNDDFGGPDLAQVMVDGSPMMMSGTSARYVKTVAFLEWVFSGKLAHVRIVEIGAGYGGLCSALFNSWVVDSYGIFDLSGPRMLQSAFLFKCLGVSHEYMRMTRGLCWYDLTADVDSDLAIAVCSVSELPRPLQVEYFQKVLRHAKRGFLIWNSGYTKGEDVVPQEEAQAWIEQNLGFAVECLTDRCKQAGIDYPEAQYTYTWDRS